MANIQAPALSGDQIERLRQLGLMYFEEAIRCFEAKAFIAASVMFATALEAHLLDWAVGRSGQPKKQSKKGLMKCNLGDLLTLAKQHGWLPHDYINDVRKVILPLRNAAVHPGRWIQDSHSAASFDSKRIETVVRKVLDAHVGLVKNVVQSLDEKVARRVPSQSGIG